MSVKEECRCHFLQGWSFLLSRVFQGDTICIDDSKA